MTENKLVTSFLLEVSKLEAIEFLGLTKIFCVPLFDANGKERPFEEMFSDVIDRFISLKKSKRKEILKMLKQSNLSKIEL